MDQCGYDDFSTLIGIQLGHKRPPSTAATIHPSPGGLGDRPLEIFLYHIQNSGAAEPKPETLYGQLLQAYNITVMI